MQRKLQRHENVNLTVQTCKVDFVMHTVPFVAGAATKCPITQWELAI